MGANGDEIRIIVLEDGQHLDSVIRKIEKGWIVRFKRGSSLLGKNVRVTTSLSPEPLSWSAGKDHLSVYCQVKCDTAGSFRYSFSTDDGTSEAGSGYFLVMPELKVNGKPLPLDGIACQTYLAKLLGELPEWKERLRVAKESGYNMIHLTPIHELGISNSSYSISDHHAIIATVGSKNGFEDVHKLVQEIEKEWEILTVQDVVWNHAAKNSKWLLQHPDSAYNCHNSPHLRPAYVIDRVYHQFGKEVGEGVWAHRGIPPIVENIHHVNAIEYLLRAEILPKADLHEFYQVDLKAMVKLFEALVKQSGGPTDSPLDGEEVQIVQDPEYRRFGNTVDFDRSLRIFNRERGDANSEEERVRKVVESFENSLHTKNLDAARESWETVLAGLRAVMGHITYEREAGHGPKRGLVCPEAPLTTDYFLHLEADVGWKSEEKFAYDEEKSKLIMAFNGWVMSSNPLDNFALKSSQVSCIIDS
uniref:Glycogen debranching enzyme glucanotransferase domain-containing protein n=1 Tax=Caenorhabditis japonica TaxID=281687 RepID=A0A8R1IU78_CAEJA